MSSLAEENFAVKVRLNNCSQAGGYWVDPQHPLQMTPYCQCSHVMDGLTQQSELGLRFTLFVVFAFFTAFELYVIHRTFKEAHKMKRDLKEKKLLFSGYSSTSYQDFTHFRNSCESSGNRRSQSSRKTSLLSNYNDHRHSRRQSTDHHNVESARNSLQPPAGISSLPQDLADGMYERLPQEYVISEEYEMTSGRNSAASSRSGSGMSQKSSSTRSSSSASSGSFGIAPEPDETQSRWKRSDSTKRAHQLSRFLFTGMTSDNEDEDDDINEGEDEHDVAADEEAADETNSKSRSNSIKMIKAVNEKFATLRNSFLRREEQSKTSLDLEAPLMSDEQRRRLERSFSSEHHHHPHGANSAVGKLKLEGILRKESVASTHAPIGPEEARLIQQRNKPRRTGVAFRTESLTPETQL